MAKTNEYFLLYRTGSIHPEIVCTTVDSQDACLLRSLYNWIGCTDIEIVRPTLATSRDVRELLIVVDGEGLLRSKDQNAVASILYAGRIVGDVIIGRLVLRDGEPDIGGWETPEEAHAAATPVFREVQHVMYMQPRLKGGGQMIDRVRYYSIVWRSTVSAFSRFPSSLWYIDTDSVKTDCVPYLMCNIAWNLLYEMGV